MRSRLAALLAPVVVGFVLAMPTTTMAATGDYSFSVVNFHCIAGGYGHNPYFEVKLVAAGSTPANKLTITTVSQYLSGGSWHTSYHWATNKETFTPNGKAHSIDWNYYHNFPKDQRTWRIVSVLKALQGTNVLAQKKLTSPSC